MKALLVVLVALPALADPPRTFPAGDGCNTCTDYGNGAVTCTLLNCMPAAPVRAFTTPSDAPREESCADGPDDIPGTSVCLEAGQFAPFQARALSFPEHKRREKINARNADLWEGITKGDVVVVSKPVFYAVIAGGSAAVVAAIVLGGLAAAHKL